MSYNNNNHNNKDSNTNKLLGQLRFETEKQQLGCLLMVTGLPEIIQPLTWIAGLINGGEDEFGDPITVTEGLPFSTLFGYVCCVIIGVLAVLVGYAAAFHNGGSKELTLAVSIFVQTAYILTAWKWKRTIAKTGIACFGIVSGRGYSYSNS